MDCLISEVWRQFQKAEKCDADCFLKIAMQVENTKMITEQLQGVKSGKLTTLTKEPNQFMQTHKN